VGQGVGEVCLGSRDGSRAGLGSDMKNAHTDLGVYNASCAGRTFESADGMYLYFQDCHVTQETIS
jgi:hypothetical protein